MKKEIINFRFSRFRRIVRGFFTGNNSDVDLCQEDSPAVDNVIVDNIEKVFKSAYQSLPDTVHPSAELRSNVMNAIRRVNLPKSIFPYEEIVCWRAAWTSLAATLIIASLIGFINLREDDGTGESRIADKMVAYNDNAQE
jgi:hypothetical protein